MSQCEVMAVFKICRKYQADFKVFFSGPKRARFPSQSLHIPNNTRATPSDTSPGQFASPDYGYAPQPQADPSTPWSAPQEFRDPSSTMPIGGSTQMHPAYLRYGSTEIGQDYSPFIGAMDPNQHHLPQVGSIGYGMDREAQPWQPHAPPSRSMSYPDLSHNPIYNPSLNPNPQLPGAYRYQQPFNMQNASAPVPAYRQLVDYNISHDHRSASIPTLPSHMSPTSPGGWYSEGQPFGPGETLRGLPGQNQPGSHQSPTSRPG